MSTEKHTPGPWAWYHGGNHVALVQPGVDGRVLMMRHIDGRPTPADARLIAAAPDLLAALRELVREANANSGEVTAEAVMSAEDVIAKARGV